MAGYDQNILDSGGVKAVQRMKQQGRSAHLQKAFGTGFRQDAEARSPAGSKNNGLCGRDWGRAHGVGAFGVWGQGDKICISALCFNAL